jgi:hypothetical protein
MKTLGPIVLVLAVNLLFSTVSFAELPGLRFFNDFGPKVEVTFENGKSKVFTDYEIIWNRQFRTLDIKLKNSYSGDVLLLWVKGNNWVHRSEREAFYGGLGLFNELKKKAIRQTSHYSPCSQAFDIEI